MPSPRSPSPLPKIPSKTLHYILIATLIPTLAFDIPIIVLEMNTGAVLGVIIISLSTLLSIHRSGLLSRKHSSSQGYEYQVLLPHQETLDLRERVGEGERMFFALVDGLFAILLTVATVLVYVLKGGGRWWREPVELVVVKTWGSFPLILAALIHTYLALNPLLHSLLRCYKYKPVCSRCQAPLCEDDMTVSESEQRESEQGGLPTQAYSGRARVDFKAPGPEMVGLV